MELSDGLIGVVGTLAGTLMGWCLVSLTDWRTVAKKKKAIFVEIEDTKLKLAKASSLLLKSAQAISSAAPRTHSATPAPIKVTITEEYFKQVFIELHSADRVNISNFIDYVHTFNDTLQNIDEVKDLQKKRLHFDAVMIAYLTAKSVELCANELLKSRREIVDFESDKFIKLREDCHSVYAEMLK